MTFFTFLIAFLNAVIVWRLLDVFKPQLKAFGLRWTYHLQAFFEIHFWQIEDIKRRDLKKRATLSIVEVKRTDTPRCWTWEVITNNAETLDYETKEVKRIE